MEITFSTITVFSEGVSSADALDLVPAMHDGDLKCHPSIIASSLNRMDHQV